MPFFRTRPVLVEAIQLTPENLEAIDERFGTAVEFILDGNYLDPPLVGAVIATPEGDMSANVGDWIIRGVAGELYPCKADIFAATYEPAERE